MDFNSPLLSFTVIPYFPSASSAVEIREAIVFKPRATCCDFPWKISVF
nr:MAG TPA: hypothetical protein [Caudoviricetes sp.]